MKQSEVRREVDKLLDLVHLGIIPQSKAIQMAEQMYRLALPDPIVVGRDGRIIYQPEEPMGDQQADISMQQMKDFWAEEQAKAVARPVHRPPVAGYRGCDETVWSTWKLVSEADPAVKVVRYTGPPIPSPRAHDFSNPYLIDHHLQVGHRLCVECGHNYEDRACEPRPGWRAADEIAKATKMEARDLLAKANRASRGPNRPATYRNDVGGIGALVGRYLNVAPERGR